MANFSSYSPKLLEAEGGYQANPSDTGNYNSLGQLVGTMRGIAAPTYEDWIGRPPSVTDMKNISLDTALAIYERNYWNVLSCNLIASQPLAEIICDHGINAGPGRAGKIIQTVCNILGSTLIVDGVIGSNTRNAIASYDPVILNDSFKQVRYYYYYYISVYPENVPQYWEDLFISWKIYGSTSNRVFTDGWINRVDSFPWLGDGEASDVVETIAEANPIVINQAAKKKLRWNGRSTHS